jgi:hypothetical protein
MRTRRRQKGGAPMEPQILAAMGSGIEFTTDENQTIQRFLELEKSVDPKNPFSNADDREYNTLRPRIEKLLQTKYACLAPDEHYPDFYKQGADGKQFDQVAVLGASYIMDPTYSYKQPCYQAEYNKGRTGQPPTVSAPTPIALAHPAPPTFPETDSPFDEVILPEPTSVTPPGLLGSLLLKATDDKENGRPFDEAYFEANAPGRSKYYKNIYDQARTAPTSANPFLAPPAPAPASAPAPLPAYAPPTRLTFAARLAQARAATSPQILREKASNLAATARSGLSVLLAPPPSGAKLKGGKTRRRKLKSSRRA